MGKRVMEEAPGDGARDLQGSAPRWRPLLEIGDVAEALGLHVSGVRHLIAMGQLQVWHHTLRGCRLFDPREVERVRQARAEDRQQRRLARLRRLDVRPRMLPAKANGSSLPDATAKGVENRRKSRDVA